MSPTEILSRWMQCDLRSRHGGNVRQQNAAMSIGAPTAANWRRGATIPTLKTLGRLSRYRQEQAGDTLKWLAGGVTLADIVQYVRTCPSDEVPKILAALQRRLPYVSNNEWDGIVDKLTPLQRARLMQSIAQSSLRQLPEAAKESHRQSAPR